MNTSSSIKDFNKFKKRSLVTLLTIFPKNKRNIGSIIHKQIYDECIKKIKLQKLTKLVIAKGFSFKTFHDNNFISTKVESQVKSLLEFSFQNFQYLLSGHENGQIKVWEYTKTNSMKSLNLTLIFQANTGNVKLTKLRYLNEDVIISAGNEEIIKGWSPKNFNKSIFILNGHLDKITSLSTIKFIDEILLVSGSADNHILVWNLSNLDKPVFKLSSHTESVSALISFQSEKMETYLVSGSWDNTIQIWNLEGSTFSPSKPMKKLLGHKDSISSLLMIKLKYNNYLCSGSWDYSILIWDLIHYSKVFTLKHNNSIYCMSSLLFNGEYLLVTAGFSGSIFSGVLKILINRSILLQIFQLIFTL